MAEVIRKAHREFASEQKLEYRYRSDPGAGYSFDWDGEKAVFDIPEAEKNYRWCLERPEEVECLGVITNKWSWIEPALAKCECGEEIYLQDEYYGSCQCPHCGRWHSLWGDELNPPEDWTEDLEPDE